MVCEKNNDVQHDFHKDPLKLMKKGDWLKVSALLRYSCSDYRPLLCIVAMLHTGSTKLVMKQLLVYLLGAKPEGLSGHCKSSKACCHACMPNRKHPCQISCLLSVRPFMHFVMAFLV